MSELNLYAASDIEPRNGDDLGELARKINENHRFSEQATAEAVRYAIVAGTALIDAKAAVPYGSWKTWVSDNFDGSYWMASTYMRISHYAHVLPEGVSLKEALASLRGHGEMPMYSPKIVAEAQRLHTEDGLTHRQIAERLHATKTAVTRWVSPDPAALRRRYAEDARRRRDRGKRARRALLAQEQERAVKKAGGQAAEAYALIRRAEQAVDIARSDADGQVRMTYAAALDALYKAEDAIARALKLPGATRS